MRLTFSILFLLFPFVVFAQINYGLIERLEKVANSEVHDTIKVTALDSISWEYLYYNPKIARDYADKAIEICKRKDLVRLLGSCYNTLGANYLTIQEYDSAQVYFKMALNNYEKARYEKGLGATHSNLGIIAQEKGQLDSALVLHEKSLLHRKKAKSPTDIAKSYINIGSIYNLKNNWEEANLIYYKALHLTDSLDNIFLKGICLNNLGIVNTYLKYHNDAIRYFKEAVEIMDSLNQTHYLPMSYNNLANLYNQIQQPNTAIYYAELALLANQGHDKRTKAYSLYYLAEANMQKEAYQIALKQFKEVLALDVKLDNLLEEGITLSAIGELYLKEKKYQAAIPYLKKGQDILQQISNTGNLIKTQKNLIYAQLKVNKKPKLAEYFFNFVELNETIFSKNRLAAVKEMEIKYHKSQDSLQIVQQSLELKQQENRMQFLYFWIVCLGLLGLVGIVGIITQKRFIQLKNENLQKEIQKQQALSDRYILLEKEKSKLAEQLKTKEQSIERLEIPLVDVLKYGSYHSEQHGVILPYHNITYITSKEAKRNNVLFQLKNGDIHKERAIINHLSQILDSRVFVRVNRFYIVNILETEWLSGNNLKMKNGQFINISEKHKKDLDRTLNAFQRNFSAQNKEVSSQ